MSGPNSAQAEFWEELTPSWLEAERHTRLVSQRFGEMAIDRLDLVAGQRVLDIGCGAGGTTLELAARVGPDGEAVGADIASAMVRAAQQRAGDAGVRNVRFLTADLQVDDLGTGLFDAAFSQFGVMFFAEPAAAFAHIRRTIHPGGTLAFSCWQSIFSNEWMFVPGSAVVSVTGSLPPMPGPDEPGPFSLAEPDRVTALLSGAGFTHIEVEPRDEVVVLVGDQIDSLVEMSRNVGVVREALRDADEDTSARIIDAVRAALAERVVDGELRLTAGALIVTAHA
ncbi:MAG: class I SAM-dependent methyltransferase [Acidimicrobiales bacterium]